MTRKKRVDKRPDGKPHIIDDNGRTCTACSEYKRWSHYAHIPKGRHGHAARCNDCLSKIAGKNRAKRIKKANTDAFDTPINQLLMRKWV
jgi:hypothetical protein